MILWRIGNHPALDGQGGLRAHGRWHSRGRRIVYCAPNPAAALIETLVHAEIDMEDIPVTFRYIEIEAPDSVPAEALDLDVLGPDWWRNMDATRRAGDEWLRSGRCALLRVPSAVVPATWNVLINPRHPHSSQIRIGQIHDYAVDRRLLR